MALSSKYLVNITDTAMAHKTAEHSVVWSLLETRRIIATTQQHLAAGEEYISPPEQVLFAFTDLAT